MLRYTVGSPADSRSKSSVVGPDGQIIVPAPLALDTESGLCRGHSNKNHS